MLKIGTGELMVIMAIALLVFGPSKLPELGKVVGETLGTFKRHMNSVTDEFDLTDSKPVKKSTKAAQPVQTEPNPEPEATESVIANDGKEEKNG